MKGFVILFFIVAIPLSTCGSIQPDVSATHEPTMTPTQTILATSVPEVILETETLQAVATFTPLSGPCVTPEPGILDVFINHSITIEDNGKTFVTHITSRFWIYLDDRVYSLRDLLNAIPVGLIGYVSNGSVRGPQCYPIYFEAIREGKGLIKLKDFQLSIIVDNNLPMSKLPMH